MRLIDADALIEEYSYASNDWDRARQKFALIVVDVNDIKNAPTIDAVSVVRCKECKYFWKYSDLPTKCVFHLSHVNADDFCSYGERSRQ